MKWAPELVFWLVSAFWSSHSLWVSMTWYLAAKPLGVSPCSSGKGRICIPSPSFIVHTFSLNNTVFSPLSPSTQYHLLGWGILGVFNVILSEATVRPQMTVAAAPPSPPPPVVNLSCRMLRIIFSVQLCAHSYTHLGLSKPLCSICRKSVNVWSPLCSVATSTAAHDQSALGADAQCVVRQYLWYMSRVSDTKLKRPGAGKQKQGEGKVTKEFTRWTRQIKQQGWSRSIRVSREARILICWGDVVSLLNEAV